MQCQIVSGFGLALCLVEYQIFDFSAGQVKCTKSSSGRASQVRTNLLGTNQRINCIDHFIVIDGANVILLDQSKRTSERIEFGVARVIQDVLTKVFLGRVKHVLFKVTEAKTNYVDKTQSQITSETQTHAIQSSDFKNMIEMWGGYQSNSITDSEMINYLGITTNKDSQSIIPKWFKVNFSEWILHDRINEEDMKIALKWMEKKNIIQFE